MVFIDNSVVSRNAKSFLPCLAEKGDCLWDGRVNKFGYSFNFVQRAPSTTPDFPEESPASGDRLDEFKGVPQIYHAISLPFDSK
jgi:hypothetical protein